jgi:hypothetical protein
MSSEAGEDRTAKMLDLARTEAKAEQLIFSGSPWAKHVSEKRKELDPIWKDLNPTATEKELAFHVVRAEREAQELAERKMAAEDQFDSLSKRLDNLDQDLRLVLANQPKANAPANAPAAITDKSRVSWIALMVTALATLLASAILVLPFLYLVMKLPVGAPAETRTVEVSLDIAALVAAILGGGGIAAAGIAYAAGQLGIGPGKGPPEGGPETTGRRESPL